MIMCPRYWAHFLRPCYLVGRWGLAGGVGLGGLPTAVTFFRKREANIQQGS